MSYIPEVGELVVDLRPECNVGGWVREVRDGDRIVISPTEDGTVGYWEAGPDDIVPPTGFRSSE